jgi:quinol monooxygenase YgiN
MADAERHDSDVVIVTGAVVGRPDARDELLAAALDHVRRSRTEPGCISHAVHQDVENPDRFFFFEQWADRQSLDAHFQVPESGEFVRKVERLAAEPPSLSIYSAHKDL